jgi:hypothetical protein
VTAVGVAWMVPGRSYRITYREVYGLDWASPQSVEASTMRCTSQRHEGSTTHSSVRGR